MTFTDRHYWSALIKRDDGTEFLSCAGGEGCAPAIFGNAKGVGKHLKTLREYNFKCRRVRVRVLIEEVA